MKYMFLIYGEESNEAQLTAAERDAMLSEYFAFSKETRAKGVYIDGDELKPTATATTLRPYKGQLATTDGPYAETKEQLGGYYLIEVPSLDEALKWAAKCPGSWGGSIEVRPLQENPASA